MVKALKLHIRTEGLKPRFYFKVFKPYFNSEYQRQQSHTVEFFVIS